MIMTPEQLIALCKAPVDGLDGKPVVPEHIYLTIPKKSLPRDCIRLAGRQGPLGRVCTVNDAPKLEGYICLVVAVFKRKDVINFLEARING